MGHGLFVAQVNYSDLSSLQDSAPDRSSYSYQALTLLSALLSRFLCRDKDTSSNHDLSELMLFFPRTDSSSRLRTRYDLVTIVNYCYSKILRLLTAHRYLSFHYEYTTNSYPIEDIDRST